MSIFNLECATCTLTKANVHVLRISRTIGMEEGKNKITKRLLDLYKTWVKPFNTLPSVEASSIRTHCSTIQVRHASAHSSAHPIAQAYTTPVATILPYADRYKRPVVTSRTTAIIFNGLEVRLLLRSPTSIYISASLFPPIRLLFGSRSC